MSKHKIIVNKWDKCLTDLLIKFKQEEGWYEYIPYEGDEITVTFRDASGTVKDTQTYEVPDANAKRITIEMPTTLDAGEYTYDVVLTTEDEEVYTMCENNIFIIKEEHTT